MKIIFLFIVNVWLFFFANIAVATVPTTISAHEVLTGIGNNLFKRIREQKYLILNDPQMMSTIVEQELMPYVDHRYVAYKILGKNLKKMSKGQRTKFVIVIKKHLTRTYANVLRQYNNQKVTFEPEKNIKGRKIVSIKANISNEPKADIIIDFKMRMNKKTKQWKAFDMVVEGISLLSSKQAEINSRIRSHGIDQVTIDLANLNNKQNVKSQTGR